LLLNIFFVCIFLINCNQTYHINDRELSKMQYLNYKCISELFNNKNKEYCKNIQYFNQILNATIFVKTFQK